MQPLPPDVIAWFKTVFRECNESLSEKLSNNPNVSEGSLDQTWIDHLSQYASPITLSSSWTVKIETHNLGGMRHWSLWEIGDIGILVFFRQGGRIQKSKVALLQSKRLYPSTNVVREDDIVDYRTGFARLADPESLQQASAVQAEFQFSEQCKYGALESGSDQVKAITAYQDIEKIPVYYQFYNPWTVPFVQRIPLTRYGRPHGDLALGTRVIPSTHIHQLLAQHGARHKPSLAEIKSIGWNGNYGCPLETFVADLLLGCKEGFLFQNIGEERIQNLFYRRSGPISAAIAVWIESPE